MTPNRRPSRILAMQALCQWEVQRDESHEALLGFLQRDADTLDAVGYASELVLGFWEHRDDIDRRLEEALTGWSLPRLSPVERNVLRVCVVEMLDTKVPPKAALTEAIEIGREFGGAETPKFINGVLDAVLATLPARAGD